MKKLFRILTLCAVAGGVYIAADRPAAAQHKHGNHHQAAKPKTYRNVRAQIVGVVKPKRAGDKTAVTLDHEAIPNFMKAMRMTLPLKNAADARRVKPGAKIQFDMLLQDGNFLIANIRPLPPRTKLKLAGH